MLAVEEILAFGAFFGLLSCLAASDLRSFRLPFKVNMAFLATGLIAGGVAFSAPLGDRLIGAGAGYLALAVVAHGYRLARGHQGMGGGDPILLAGLGGWMGWQALPVIVLSGSVIGLVLSVPVCILRDENTPLYQLRLPFGTLLALAALSHIIFTKI